MAKIGRNEPCPCGSGKKYKKCCLKKDTAQARAKSALSIESDWDRWRSTPDDLLPYAKHRLFERSDEFARMTKFAPTKAERFWTTEKVARLGIDEIRWRLLELGIDASQAAYVARAEHETSAWAVADEWLRGEVAWPDGVPSDDFVVDFVHLASCELWRHDLAGRPSIEMIDDWVQAGYEHMEGGRATKSCDSWWPAWTVIRDRLEPDMTTIADAAARVFEGTQSIFNWVQDLSIELGNAAIDDPKYAGLGIELGERVLSQFTEETDELFLTNFRADLGDFYFRAGRDEDGERLFMAMIDERPDEAIGYARFADQLAHPRPGSNRTVDSPRAIALLERALLRPVVDAADFDLELRLEGLQRAAQKAAAAVAGDTTIRP